MSRAAAHTLRAAIIASPVAVLACTTSATDDDNETQNSSGGVASTGGTDSSGGKTASGGQVASGGDLGIDDGTDIVQPDGGQGGMGGWVGIPIYGGPFPDMMRAKV